MNEKIRQLKEQAMEWVPNMADPDTKIRLLNAGKFADLIIRECAAAVAKANNPLGRNIDKVFEMHFGAKR